MAPDILKAISRYLRKKLYGVTIILGHEYFLLQTNDTIYKFLVDGDEIAILDNLGHFPLADPNLLENIAKAIADRSTEMVQGETAGRIFGRYDWTEPVNIDHTDPGTAILLEIRYRYPSHEYHQVGPRVGSPVTQINSNLGMVLYLSGTGVWHCHGNPVDLNNKEEFKRLIEIILK